MTDIRIDPATLPMIDIIGLANTGRIVRIDQHAQPDAALNFIPAADWQTLSRRIDSADDGASPDRDAQVRLGISRCVPHILAHISGSGPSAARDLASFMFTMPSDLFSPSSDLLVAFVRDRDHPVACLLFGSPAAIRDVLFQDNLQTAP